MGGIGCVKPPQSLESEDSGDCTLLQCRHKPASRQLHRYGPESTPLIPCGGTHAVCFLPALGDTPRLEDSITSWHLPPRALFQRPSPQRPKASRDEHRRVTMQRTDRVSEKCGFNPVYRNRGPGGEACGHGSRVTVSPSTLLLDSPQAAHDDNVLYLAGGAMPCLHAVT